ncbi:hypothetical protein [Euzebya sp.]|uniref:hypothetical protein n=1 Tax=Euzebya sp. TaxID=1971409 RepID=UPI00351128B4
MPAQVVDVVRIAVVAGVGLLLVRSARAAWSRRRLAVEVWGSIRPRHVVGSLGLVVVVMAVLVLLLWAVPVTGYGLGSLVGLDGNAVFAPIEGTLEAPVEGAITAAETGRAAPAIPWTDVAVVTGFLALLVALFPHLAHAEESAFRTGWEDLDGWGQAWSALRFGLVHLIMLIPVAAALAIAVAGFTYGRIYLRAYRRAAVPRVVHVPGRLPLAEDADGYTRLVMGPPTPVLAVDRVGARRSAVLAATVWHTTFNTTIAVVVWAAYVLSL